MMQLISVYFVVAFKKMLANVEKFFNCDCYFLIITDHTSDKCQRMYLLHFPIICLFLNRPVAIKIRIFLFTLAEGFV